VSDQSSYQDGYQSGYQDGESNVTADVFALCEQLDVEVDGDPLEALKREVETLRRRSTNLKVDELGPPVVKGQGYEALITRDGRVVGSVYVGTVEEVEAK
jgi:hypothetical protein